MEFIDMLASAGFTNINARSTERYTALHRVAAYGTSGDIQRLLRLGADPAMRTYKLLWTPVFAAAKLGNHDTFQALAAVSPERFIHASDVRGWTLLHVAVSSASFGIVEVLLAAGADPHRLSIPAAALLSNGLHGRCLAAADIVAHRGPGVLSAYRRALRSAGYDVDVDVDEQGDIF
ncbi:ankyrin repeat-containing domain protein [Lasiosphaeria hispida]|uniref:Ankyrin repeat-containing domain protein n=1 Tax=Lasiosphaeria hispida TaxID=260671 RepID=A0AAJ0MCC4_9PEZI|nr:ankyrin repeat-containing domain protein [Lasiosphaeria hispida]